VSEDTAAYSAWARRTEAEAIQQVGDPGDRPLTLIMLIEGEPPTSLIPTLQSLQQQTSGKWALVVVIDESWRTTLTAMITVSGLRHSSQRVRVVVSDQAAQPGAMFDLALAAVSDSDIALLAPGDVWAPTAVAVLRKAISPGTVAYADEDCIAADGQHHTPRLKPSYSPEFLLHSFYMGRPMVLSSDVVARLPSATSAASAVFAHDLAIRATEVAQQVVHVPEVLCHRTSDDGTDPAPSTTLHIEAALRRRDQEAKVETSCHPGSFAIRRRVARDQLVSVIIPFRDEPQFLRTCIDSLDRTAQGQPFELLLVDNGSVQPETATLLDRLAERPDTRVVPDERPFNWAVLNNFAAAQASGEILLFLNNDIEAHRDGWLQALCAQAARPEIGVVGARLLYPDHRLQHGGVVIGLGGAAGHLFVGLDESKSGYLQMAVTTRECAGVTGACFATRHEVFESLDGFDESLGVDLNDIDYCLRAQRSGLRVLYEPEAELIHHESPSRGTAGDVRDIVHFLERWETTIAQGDPYLNPHLTRVDSSCALRDPGEGVWWEQWRSNLSPPA
jgi:GT2 family glycosyltransferase